MARKSKPVNGKQRVHAAMRRAASDRIPVWMWFHPQTVTRLANALKIPPATLADVMGDDVRQAWVGNNSAMEGIVHVHDDTTHTDCWGIEWVKNGPFNQIKRSPLHDATPEQISAYRYPYEHTDALLTNMAPVMARSRDFFVGCDISPCLFEMACRVRGMEAFTLDLAGEPQLAEMMLAQAGEFAITLAETACQRYAIDWLWTGDDVASQHAMIMSPSCWRTMIRPHLARIFAVAKKRAIRVAYHSCGAIRPIIPDLIDMGLDVLNPIQPNCPGMEPLELKREFGCDLTFMGGVDTQYLLPRGSVREVYDATRRLVDGMSAGGGGFILAASHAIPPETPFRNIFAVYRAAGIMREEILARAAGIQPLSLANVPADESVEPEIDVPQDCTRWS